MTLKPRIDSKRAKALFLSGFQLILGFVPTVVLAPEDLVMQLLGQVVTHFGIGAARRILRRTVAERRQNIEEISPR